MTSEEAGSTSLLDASPTSVVGSVLTGFDIAIRSAPSSVEVARRVMRAWMRRYCPMPGEHVDAVLVVISELCTNAVQHGRRESFNLRGWMPAPGELRLEVGGGSPCAVLAPQQVGSEAESGRGLFLVDVLMTELGGSWGFSADGTCAWCRLDLGLWEEQ